MTADPEIKETPNGQKVATFSIATNRKWKDSSGVLQEDTEFHNCVAWRGLAEILEQYAQKGKKVYVEGYLKTRSWDDTAGVKRYKTEIVSDSIILLSSASGGNADMKKSKSTIDEDFPPEKIKETVPARKHKPKMEEDICIEDIPF